MAIPANKKRYSVTLTPALVDRFHRLCRDLAIPPSAMSSSFDDFLASINDVMQLWVDDGKIDVNRLKSLMGKQMKLIDEEEAKNVANPKRNTLVNR